MKQAVINAGSGSNFAPNPPLLYAVTSEHQASTTPPSRPRAPPGRVIEQDEFERCGPPGAPRKPCESHPWSCVIGEAQCEERQDMLARQAAEEPEDEKDCRRNRGEGQAEQISVVAMEAEENETTEAGVSERRESRA